MKKLIKAVIKPFILLPISLCFCLGAAIIYTCIPFAWLYNKIYVKETQKVENNQASN